MVDYINTFWLFVDRYCVLRVIKYPCDISEMMIQKLVGPPRHKSFEVGSCPLFFFLPMDGEKSLISYVIQFHSTLHYSRPCHLLLVVDNTTIERYLFSTSFVIDNLADSGDS